MELQARVTELERRLAALESETQREGPGVDEGGPAAHNADFWALRTWKERLLDAGADSGGVLFTGAVGLPSEKHYEWQWQASTESLLEDDWSDAVQSFAALGHTVRLRLLRELLQAPRSVAELSGLDDLGTTGQIYHHVRQLTGAGWLHTAGHGRYEVPPERMVPLLVMLTAAHR